MNHYDCRECNNCQAGCAPCYPPCCPPPYCPPPCPPPCPLCSYAMFNICAGATATDTNLSFTPCMIGPNGKIVNIASDEVRLAKGHIYQVSVHALASTATPGSIKLTTMLNDVAQENLTSATATLENDGWATADSSYLVSTIDNEKTICLYYQGQAATAIKGALVIVEIA